MATREDYRKARDLALQLRDRVLRNRSDVDAVRVLDRLSDLLGNTPDPEGRAQTDLLGLIRLAEEILAKPEGD